MLVFVLGSMASMGLSLKLKQITSSLKDTKLVIMALVANFVLVPLVAYGITLLLDAPPADWLDPPLHSRRSALPANPGRSGEGKCCIFGGTDGAVDGSDHHLPAHCSARAAWRR